MTFHRSLVRRFLTGAGLIVATSGPLLPQTPSPRDILNRFCDLDGHGEQLSPGGWEKLAALFLTPGTPRRDIVTVVKDFVVSNPAFDGNKAEFYVEYLELGQIDQSNLVFSTLPAVNVRVMFTLVRTPKTGSDREDGSEWRIARRGVPEPHLTVAAAIGYATELRAKAKDAVARQDANKLLATLKGLR